MKNKTTELPVKSKSHAQNSGTFFNPSVWERSGRATVQLENIRKCREMLEKLYDQFLITTYNQQKDEVTFILFNSHYGPETDTVDGTNIAILVRFEGFDVTSITKMPHFQPGKSYTNITLPYQKIGSIIQSLKIEEDIVKRVESMAKCPT